MDQFIGLDHNADHVRRCRSARAHLGLMALRDRIAGFCGSVMPVARGVVGVVPGAPCHSIFAQANPPPSPVPETANTQAEATKKDVDPIENSDDKKSKLTFGLYFTKGAAQTDLNLRHQWGPL